YASSRRSRASTWPHRRRTPIPRATCRFSRPSDIRSPRTRTVGCGGSPASVAGRCSSSASGTVVQPEEAVPRLRALGFSEEDAERLAAHFLWAERRGLQSHGLGRIAWLETFDDLQPGARPERVERTEGYERWDG